MLSVAIFGKPMVNVSSSNPVRLLEHQEHLTQALVGDFIQVKNVACMIMVSKFGYTFTISTTIMQKYLYF